MLVVLVDVVLRIGRVLGRVFGGGGFYVVQDDVVGGGHALSGEVVALALLSQPHNLVFEVLIPEYGVHQHFEVVAGGRVAVKVEAAGVFQDAAHFY